MTVRFDEAVAAGIGGALVKAVFAKAGKVIVFSPGVMLKLCVTVVAGSKLAFPPWLAVMEQVPAERKLIAPAPVTEQTVPVVVE